MTRSQRQTRRPAISYTRVSTKRQGREGKGHELQNVTIREFARQTGYQIVESFSDDETGMGEQSIRDRKGVVAAIALARKEGGPILVGGLDRFSRNVRTIQISVEQENIEIISCELGKGATYAVIMSKAARAEEEGKRIAQTTKSALKELKNQGILLGNRKNFGEAQRKGTAATKDKAMKRMDALASVVRDLRAGGRTTAKGIAEGLNLRGEVTARGGSWTGGNVRRLLDRVAELDRVRKEREVEDADNPEWGTW